MNIGLRYLQGIRALSTTLADELQQLVSAMQTGWQREHTIEGGHTAISATSVAAAGGLGVFGALKLSPPVDFTAPTIIPTGRIDDLYVDGIETTSWLRLYNVAGGITLTGIYVDPTTLDADIGRLLLVTNDADSLGPQDLTVAAFNVNSLPAHQFIGDVGSRAPWTLHSSEMMLLIRDRWWTARPGGSLSYGWRVLIG